MSEQVQPVRAWAEYDEWSVFADRVGPEWDIWVSPRNEHGVLWHRAGMSGLLAALPGADTCGPLRSLRVLFSTGHEMELERAWYEDGRDPSDDWRLSVTDGAEWADKSFVDMGLSDADAVQRAIDATVQMAGQHG